MAKPINGVRPPEWWKHLRKEKRTFWKKLRAKVRQALKNREEQ